MIWCPARDICLMEKYSTLCTDWVYVSVYLIYILPHLSPGLCCPQVRRCPPILSVLHVFNWNNKILTGDNRRKERFKKKEIVYVVVSHDVWLFLIILPIKAYFLTPMTFISHIPLCSGWVSRLASGENGMWTSPF